MRLITWVKISPLPQVSTHVVIFVCFLAGYRFDFIVLILVIVIFMKVELVFFIFYYCY